MFTPSAGPTLLGDRPYNHAQPIPYAKGLEPCAPAASFVEGEIYNPDLPPMEYDENLFPLCCANHITGSGGIVFSGEGVFQFFDVYSGMDCSDATLIPFPGVTQLQGHGVDPNTVMFTVPPGKNFRMRVTSVGVATSIDVGLFSKYTPSGDPHSYCPFDYTFLNWNWPTTEYRDFSNTSPTLVFSFMLLWNTDIDCTIKVELELLP